MSEYNTDRLKLTPEEIAAPTYLEWSDETLGRAVRDIAQGLQDRYGLDAMLYNAAAMVLHDGLAGMKGTTMTFTWDNGATLVISIPESKP